MFLFDELTYLDLGVVLISWWGYSREVGLCCAHVPSKEVQEVQAFRSSIDSLLVTHDRVRVCPTTATGSVAAAIGRFRRRLGATTIWIFDSLDVNAW